MSNYIWEKVQEEKIKDEQPTKISQLENDVGYITNDELPTKISQLENDVGYITNDELDAHKAESATWIRVDNLSAPVEVTVSTNLNDATVIPLKSPYSGRAVYAVEFRVYNTDDRQSQFVFFKGATGVSKGELLAAASTNGQIYIVSKIRVGDNIGFYAVSGISPTKPLYVASVYLVKDGV